MHKITQNKAPVYLCNKICYRNAIHLHNTRGNTKLHIPRYNNVYGRDRFFRKVAHSYNRILDLNNIDTNLSINNLKKTEGPSGGKPINYRTYVTWLC